MAKIAVISDVHGNLQALNRVIKTLEKKTPDIWLCLGDIVGYGPNPSECIKIIREREMLCVLGNHDAGVAGLLSIKSFRNPNQKVINLTRKMLSQNDIEWVKSLPLIISKDNWIAAHASPKSPHEWRYLDSAFKIRSILNDLDEDICFVGHTHKPALVSNSFGAIDFQKGNKFMINPGSVGQSRDGDTRASCAFVDTDNWIFENYRVEYDSGLVEEALIKLGFTLSECKLLMKL